MLQAVQPLTVHRYGDPHAKPVVLVHGFTEAGTAWPDLVLRWQARWNIYAPDLRGHGDSPRFSADELDAAPDVLLADMLDLLDEVGEPAALVGHSLGGFVALRAALARPQQVSALVLEDPAKPGGSRPDPQFVAANQAFLDDMSEPSVHMERMLRETTWSRAEVEAWARCKPRVDREYVRRGLFLGGATWEELFEALDVPTLLVIPPNSDMAPRGLRNDQVRTVVVPNAGHCVRRDNPAEYHRAVDAFLATTLHDRR